MGDTPRLLGPVSTVQKGIGFARYAKALCMAKGDPLHACTIAAQWRDTPGVEIALRSAITAGTTNSGNWADNMEPSYRQLVSEFVELLRPMSVIGRLQGLRRIPFSVRVARQTQGATV